MEFVRQSTLLLRPGGVAVHTTEFNVSSNEVTVDRGGYVFYRQRDFEQVDRDLRQMRCGLARLDLYAGDGLLDVEYDTVPYERRDPPHHVKLLLEGHVVTSALLIVRKGG